MGNDRLCSCSRGIASGRGQRRAPLTWGDAAAGHAVAALAIGAPAADRETGGQADSLPPALADARALVDAGRPAEALDRLKAFDQADPRVRLLTGVALYHADRRREAIEVLERVRTALPDGSIERREAEQVLGLSLYLEGRFAEAIPWLERTRAAVPDNLEVNFTLGQAYIQTQDAAGSAARRSPGRSAWPPAPRRHTSRRRS